MNSEWFTSTSLWFRFSGSKHFQPVQARRRQKQPTRMCTGIWNQLGADSLTSFRRLAGALPGQWMEKQHWLLEKKMMAQFNMWWRIWIRLLRKRHTERSQLVKTVKLDEVIGNYYFGLWLLSKIIYDLIKSKSLTPLSWSPLENAALFSICLHASCSL